VIDVRMREDDRIKILDGKRKLSILFRGFLAPALEHSAVQGNRMTVDVKQVT
jgi:hypothetical protein